MLLESVVAEANFIQKHGEVFGFAVSKRSQNAFIKETYCELQQEKSGL